MQPGGGPGLVQWPGGGPGTFPPAGMWSGGGPGPPPAQPFMSAPYGMPTQPQWGTLQPPQWPWPHSGYPTMPPHPWGAPQGPWAASAVGASSPEGTTEALMAEMKLLREEVKGLREQQSAAAAQEQSQSQQLAPNSMAHPGRVEVPGGLSSLHHQRQHVAQQEAASAPATHLDVASLRNSLEEVTSAMVQAVRSVQRPEAGSAEVVARMQSVSAELAELRRSFTSLAGTVVSMQQMMTSMASQLALSPVLASGSGYAADSAVDMRGGPVTRQPAAPSGSWDESIQYPAPSTSLYPRAHLAGQQGVAAKRGHGRLGFRFESQPIVLPSITNLGSFQNGGGQHPSHAGALQGHSGRR
eukprot:gene8086-1329_t